MTFWNITEEEEAVSYWILTFYQQKKKKKKWRKKVRTERKKQEREQEPKEQLSWETNKDMKTLGYIKKTELSGRLRRELRRGRLIQSVGVSLTQFLIPFWPLPPLCLTASHYLCGMCLRSTRRRWCRSKSSSDTSRWSEKGRLFRRRPSADIW